MNDRSATVSERHVLCVSASGTHRMAYREWGEHDNPRVLICVHGLTRNGRDFDDLARVLSGDFRVICPDIVGRGRSDWARDPAVYCVPQYISDIVTLIARLDVTHVNWLGTSMGGVIGMILASFDESPISRLLINDVGPEIPLAALQRIGESLGRAPLFETIDEAERYLREVNASFGDLTDAQWRHLAEISVHERPDRRLEMRYDPAITEAYHQTAARSISLWPMFDRIRCPTHVLRGAHSDLLTVETARAMQNRGPCPSITEIPGVGHAPMLMNSDQIALVASFFSGSAAPA